MTELVLYGYAGSGSAAVEAALVLAGAPYDFRELDADAGDLEAEAFAAINPRRQVPALCLADGTVVTEMPAILNHIADTHPQSGLAPPAGTSARAQADRWLAFAHANIYEGVLRYFYSARYTDDPAQADAVASAAKAYVLRHFALLDGVIGKGPFLFGQRPVVADLLIWMLAGWMDENEVAAAAPGVARLAGAVAALPALQDVVARNG